MYIVVWWDNLVSGVRCLVSGVRCPVSLFVDSFLVVSGLLFFCSRRGRRIGVFVGFSFGYHLNRRELPSLNHTLEFLATTVSLVSFSMTFHQQHPNHLLQNPGILA